MLRTSITHLFGIEHPIVQAGMANLAGARLAAAVSNAGGLGTIGSIGREPDGLREEIRRCRDLTARPFAANIVAWNHGPAAGGLLDVVVEERVPIVTLSFGEPWEALRRCHEAGAKVIVQCQDLRMAKRALAEGADVVVAQGNEAGGHTGRRGTLGFAAQVLGFAGETPVLVAGGVANGRGLAAALAMGAAGVIMGTRFKATEEFEAESWMKERIVASDGSNTVYDEIVDLPFGGLWPNGVTGRVIANAFTEHWLDRDAELLREVAERGGVDAFAESMVDAETAMNWAGESAGLVEEVWPAAEVVRRTVEEAERLLRAVAHAVV